MSETPRTKNRWLMHRSEDAVQKLEDEYDPAADPGRTEVGEPGDEQDEYFGNATPEKTTP